MSSRSSRCRRQARCLLKYDNVVLCTHMGGMDHDSAIATSSLAAQCIVDLYNNRWPEACVVNRPPRAVEVVSGAGVSPARPLHSSAGRRDAYPRR